MDHTWNHGFGKFICCILLLNLSLGKMDQHELTKRFTTPFGSLSFFCLQSERQRGQRPEEPWRCPRNRSNFQGRNSRWDSPGAKSHRLAIFERQNSYKTCVNIYERMYVYNTWTHTHIYIYSFKYNYIIIYIININILCIHIYIMWYYKYMYIYIAIMTSCHL